MTVTRMTVNTENENTVVADVLSNGYFVSTVLLSVEVAAWDSLLSMFPQDDRADLSAPGDFETMVFECDPDGKVTNWTELDFRRYSNKVAAAEGHEEIVKRWMEN